MKRRRRKEKQQDLSVKSNDSIFITSIILHYIDGSNLFVYTGHFIIQI